MEGDHISLVRTITAIETQKSDPNRLSIFLDGAFGFGVDREVALKTGLRVGQELDEARIAEVQDSEAVSRATNAALRLLSERSRSSQEIVRRLRQKEFSADTIASVVERLIEWKYLDDEAFARQWVENRDTHRPRGKRLLASELAQKGISRDEISAALKDRGDSDLDLAIRAAQSRMSALSGYPPAVQQQRLTTYLARRGFDYGVIRLALETLATPQPFEEDDERQE